MSNVGFSWRNRSVFVTGATGLLGSWVVAELQNRGAKVTGLVRDNVGGSLLWTLADGSDLTTVSGRLEDADLLARVVNEYEVEVVFHLGAQTIVQIANRNPLSTFETNVRGTWNILEVCRLSPLVHAVLVASSDKAYGDHETLPYDESTPLQGRHPYDVSKSCADLISLAYFETYRLPVCVARCGNLFGPGDLNFNRLIPGTIRSVLQGLPVLIRSDGLAVRDYLYVRDAAVAYVDLAQQMISDGISGEPFNFSNELQLGVLDVVNEIARVLEVDIEPTVLNEATGEIRHQYLSAAKARAWLGWKPRFSLEQGLRETAEWYRDGSLPPL